MTTRKLAVIGAGRLGEAIIAGVIRVGLYSPADIIATVRREDRARELRDRYDVNVTMQNPAAVASSAVVILALKPQTMLGDVSQCRPVFTGDHTIISVAAGIRTTALEATLGNVRIVRAMPNTPVMVDAGMTALARGTHATDGDLSVATQIFGSVGAIVEVAEDRLDAVTAISGSGPAYLFLFAEALTDAAVAEGLSAEVATQLVSQMLYGSAKMLTGGGDAAALREQVTSPGGTTAAAIEVFERGNLRELVAAAVSAAHARGRELGSQ
ncbi:MAG: pyrroline-5-carboxylate reductase [Nitriliruptoraceae bacterium]